MIFIAIVRLSRAKRTIGCLLLVTAETERTCNLKLSLMALLIYAFGETSATPLNYSIVSDWATYSMYGLFWSISLQTLPKSSWARIKVSRFSDTWWSLCRFTGLMPYCAITRCNFCRSYLPCSSLYVFTLGSSNYDTSATAFFWERILIWPIKLSGLLISSRYGVFSVG